MPVFIRPARVVVDQGGGRGGNGAVPVAATAAAIVLAVLGLVALVTEWWPVFAAGAVLTVAVTGLAMRVLSRRTVSVWHSQVAAPPRPAGALRAPYRIRAPKAVIPGSVLAIGPPPGQPRPGDRDGVQRAAQQTTKQHGETRLDQG